MRLNIYVYIFIMAGVTYLIRVLPLAFVRREIRHPFVRSFLYYVPYATLAAMTFPAILYSSASVVSACAGFAVALILAYRQRSLTTVALCACVTVFLVERLI